MRELDVKVYLIFCLKRIKVDIIEVEKPYSTVTDLAKFLG